MSQGVLNTGHRLGEYRIVEMVGRGGMGVVYKAEDPQGRPVAIKLLLRGSAVDDRARRRFRRETRASSGLEHPNIVAVLDSGEDGGLPYLVLEYVGGGSLE